MDMTHRWENWEIRFPAESVRESGSPERFLHDAPLMLLDEPTSNLDSLNEGIVLKSLRESCRDKTMIIVSHRESTMAAAQKVYKMNNERVS